MCKKVIKLSTIIISILSIMGCGTKFHEFFEPTTYGVPNSKWYLMTDEERRTVKQEYYQEQQLKMNAQQLELNEQLIKEQRQKNMLLEEQNALLKEQSDRARRGW